MRDFITYYNLLPKNYLNLSYAKINSPTRSRELSTTLAGAIFKINKIKKIKKENYSTTLETLTVNSSLILSTHHSILSPDLTLSILAIVAGTLLLTALVLLAPLMIFVFCLNITTMTSMFILNYYYIYTTQYLKFVLIRLMKRVIFIYYHNQFIITDMVQKRQLLKTYLKNPMRDLYERI